MMVKNTTPAAAAEMSSSSAEVDNKKCWWKSLEDEECPITLESLASLPYPPFALARNNNNNNDTTSNSVAYFDGVALASYIISRGIFENPLTRQELTYDTCKRLDDHLNEYCSDYLEGIGGARQISVAEAYALRSIVHVEERGGMNNNNNNSSSSNSNETRARILRNTATAALAGLFVYGSDRQRRQRRQTRRQTQAEEENDQGSTHVAELPREDRLILEWGFDLSRQVEETAEYGGNGWTVIDDDEALVVASKREAYQATQNAFPRLSDSSADAAAGETAVDDQFLETVRQVAATEQENQAQRERRLQLARQQLLQEALQRREERKREKIEKLKKAAEQSMEKKKEIEELEQARVEIEAWRDEQWERLRKISESYQQQQKKKEQPTPTTKEDTSPETKEAPLDAVADETNQPCSEEQKKAKAAAKRKRAKARKKAQKAEERARQEEKRKEEELSAKKAASSVNCAACGQGILDCGFEKLGQKFCSPKCARTAVRIR